MEGLRETSLFSRALPSATPSCHPNLLVCRKELLFESGVSEFLFLICGIYYINLVASIFSSVVARTLP